MPVGGAASESESRTPPGSAQVRRAEYYRTRAELRRVSNTRRVRACGLLPVTHVEVDPCVVVKQEDGVAKASWHGLGACGHIWDCPVCSPRLRAERAKRIIGAIRHLAGRWQMVTLTVRHREGQALQKLQRGLVAAWRRTRQGGKVQRLWGELVTASARTLEVTRGPNGWHVHLHVLLRTEEWGHEECRTLFERYRKAVERELGADCVPSYSHAIRWSPPRVVPQNSTAADVRRLATYIAKFSLEVAGVSKLARGGNVDTWAVGLAAARGSQKALRDWHDFQFVMRGRRCIELDDRASQAADMFLALERLEGDVRQGEDVVRPDPIEIPVARDDVRWLRLNEHRREGGRLVRPAIMASVLRAAELKGAAGVAQWIELSRQEVTRARAARTMQSHGSEESGSACLGGARTAGSTRARERGTRWGARDGAGEESETPPRASQAPS